MPSPNRAKGSPVRRPSSFVRDLGVTVVVFLALVGAVASWLWIRDAVEERVDRVATAVSEVATSPTAGATPASGSQTTEAATSASTPAPSTSAAPTPAAPSRWVPVVEVFAPGTERDVAEQRAMAVTALGFPVTAMNSDEVDGIDAGSWVLVGIDRDSLDDALAFCEGRALLRTCQANTLAD